MVDHLTRVTADHPSPRAEVLARTLEGLGFSVTRERGRIRAESGSVEAAAVKRALRDGGLHDSEYRVVVEFVRQWGVM